MAIYKGFSFNSKNFKLDDVGLVNENLVSHINTPLNSRIHLLDFGTDISDSEGTNITQDYLYSYKVQLDDVIAYDPRVELLTEVNVVSAYDDNTVAGIVNLKYTLLDTEDRFEFTKNLSNGN